MNRLIPIVSAVGLLAAAVGCRKMEDDTAEKLDKVLSKLDAMDKKMDQIAQNRGPARPAAPQEPDPRLTYAVPVTESDFPRGPATAKVTIVEAADFA